MASVSPIGVNTNAPGNSSSSLPPPTLRDWVHATSKGTRRFLSHWWHGASNNNSVSPSKAASSPAPAMIAAICARDTEDLPLEEGDASSSRQFCYTCYDSDNGDDENDDELQLELLKQLAMNESDPPASGSSRASYFMYSSQKSGSAAA